MINSPVIVSGRASESSSGWVRSTRCRPGNDCIELELRGQGVRVRDSKDTAGGTLHFDWGVWQSFVTSVDAVK